MQAVLWCLLLTLPLNLHAQTLPEPLINQSSPSLEWETISNDYVKLIYPTYLKNQSVYLANLVEHYSQFAGKTYGIEKPKQFPLIIRGEMSEPNGFVTLAPRRSEWFSSGNYTTYIGSSEWYQTLSIHEYRHVNQFDYFNQSTVKYAGYLFGETAEQLAAFLGLQPWMLEGDAVWTETKYTDAGRGRSPEFLARLKALVLSNRIPTYDEFIAGTYKNQLVNHYVFGYVLVSNAYKKYGQDFWKKVYDGVAKFPHPFRFTEVFQNITDQSFSDFYNETMNDLKKEWSKDYDPSMIIGEFRDSTYPFKAGPDLYYLHNTLDTHWELQKNGKKLLEIPFIKSIDQFNLVKNYATYAQIIPDKRYGYKGSSDLVLIDLKKLSRKRITFGKRLYSPRLNNSETKIIAAEFNEANEWILAEYDLNGKRTRSVNFKNLLVTEAVPFDDNHAIAIMSDSTGKKFIAKVDFSAKENAVILPPSRNNIHALNLDKNNNIFFEAQYKGAVDIFKLSLAGEISQCTKSAFASHAPYSDGSTLYYSEDDTNGSKISNVDIIQCVPLEKESLVNFNYLSDSPSDNYNKFPIQTFDDQKEMHSKDSDKYTPEKYGDFTKELVIPHSWSFIGGRGFDLSAKTDNYLSTLGMNFSYGSNSEEKDTNYAEFSFDIKKYYPLINLSAGVRNRKVEFYKTEDYLEWKEKIAGVSVLLPYIYKKNLYQYTLGLGGAGNYLDTRSYAFDSAAQSGNQNFLLSTAFFSFDVAKELTARSIYPEWSLSYKASYDNADGENDLNSSYRMSHSADITVPGFFNQNAFKFSLGQEKQKATGYRFLPALASPLDYVFSRGYEYRDVAKYEKLAANYTFPIAYPDLNVSGFYFLKRVIGNGFFDSTHVEYTGKGETLNSYGAELMLESRLFRILPLNIGLRYVHKMQDEANLGQLFVAINLMD